MNIKITAGLGSIDDYIAYAEAGADEVFIGYVPESWTTKYGIYSPLNRREVLYYNVQIGSKSELEILHDMYLVYQVPVQIALNALYYQPEQYPEIVRIMKECSEVGFSSFIIADMGLLIYLDALRNSEEDADSEFFKSLKISISGELSEMNQKLLNRLIELQADRIIFHRYVSLEEMNLMVSGTPLARARGVPDTHTIQTICHKPMEYEAFVLNEKCRFHGAYCNSLHCDEFCHMCHVPYVPSVPSKADVTSSASSATKSSDKVLSPYELAESEGLEDFYLPGESGCGLCALWDLQEAGITHLKVVGRGNYSDAMLADIKALKKALSILQNSASKDDYIRSMKKELFPYGCSGECYY